MEKKISLSTITVCIATLQVRFEKLQQSIAGYDNPEDVPSWMYEGISDLKFSIDELKSYIGL